MIAVDRNNLLAAKTRKRLLRFLCLFAAIPLFVVACSTTPRVVEVSSKTYHRDTRHQRQDYFVRWAPATVALVKFEYRQVRAPNKIVEQTYVPERSNSTVFEIEGASVQIGRASCRERV